MACGNFQLCSIKIKGSHAPCDITCKCSIRGPEGGRGLRKRQEANLHFVPGK